MTRDDEVDTAHNDGVNDTNNNESLLMQQVMEESLRLHRQHLQDQQRQCEEENRMIRFLHEQHQAEARLNEERKQEERKEQEQREQKRQRCEEQWTIQESLQSHREHLQRQQLNSYATNYIVSRTETKVEGAWDCPSCTFLNPPYAPKCEACRFEAPQHVLTYRPFPQNVRFGIEIEIIVPLGKRDGFTLDSISEQLTLLGPHRVTHEQYRHQQNDLGRTHWKIVTDSSIHPGRPGHDLCFELVSPILMGAPGLNQIRDMLDAIRRIGIEQNKSCGFHVHVDAEDGQSITSFSTLRQLKRIARAFVALENAFDLIVGEARRAGGRKSNKNKYCQSNRIAFGQMSNRQRWNTISEAQTKHQVVELMNPNRDRYRKLNLTNVIKSNRPSTIEFRHHGGVEDLREVEAWVRLVMAFCENAARNDNQDYLLLHESSGVEDEVRALFRLIKCRGLEQVFILDRRLFAQNRMKNVWTCKVCRRQFADCRSLSQHCSATGHQP